MNGKCLFGMCLAFGLAANAGNVCTWRGTGADTSWQTSANWDVAPTDGNGDTLVFETGMGGVNGTAGFSVGRIICLGSAPVTIDGEAFVLTGDIAVSNTVPLTVNAPMTLAADTRLTHFNTATYNETVTVDGAHNIYIGPNAKALYTVTFQSGLEAREANIGLQQGEATNIKNVRPVRFNGPLHAGKVFVSCNYKTSLLELGTTGNSWNACSCGFGHIRACCRNAYPADAVLDWSVSEKWAAGHTYLQGDLSPGNKDYREDYSDLYDAYDLNGFDQTIDRIQSTKWPVNGNSVFKESFSVNSDTPATLTMNATADGICYARIMGAVSLVWSPAEDRTLTFSNRVHATTGSITVEKGKVKTVGSCVFSNLTAIVVKEGATFDLSSKASDALRSLASLTLERNATLLIGDEALTPFGAARPAIRAEEGARIVIPPGTTLTAASLLTSGTLHFDETVTSGVVTGGGSLVVDAARAGTTYWQTAEDGAWSDGTKWTAGTEPAATDSIFVTVSARDYAVRVESPVAISGSVMLANNQGNASTIALAVSNTFAYAGSDMTIGYGVDVAVGAGGTFTMSPAADVERDDVVLAVRGGRLTVDGGTVDFTGGDGDDKSDANFRGWITVEGADDRPGEVAIKSGVFKMIPWWGGSDGNRGSRMQIGEGGRLAVSGGLCQIHTGWWWNEPLVQDGGDVDVSGTGVMEIDCRSPLLNGNKTGGVVGFFGTGSVTFRDSAELRQPDNANAYIYMPTARDNVPRDLALTFSDQAKFTGVGTLMLGGFVNVKIPEAARSHHVALTLDSDADHEVGRSLIVGVNVGTSEATMRRGSLTLKKGSLFLPFHNNHSKNTTLPVAPKGVFRMTGGRLSVNGSMWTTSKDPAGFLLGNTLPLPTSASYAFNGGIGDYAGTFDLSGGVVTNNAGAVIVGAGCGRGVFRQSGGSFVHKYEQFSLVGFLGGDGTYEVAGGSNEIWGDLYVGGATTNTLGWGALTTTGFVQNAMVDLTAHHDARGLLKVTGGTFDLRGGTTSARGNLVFSDDGAGTLEIGAAGAVNARNVIFKNGAASRAKFVFGPDGRVGAVTAAEALTVSPGTKLTLDLSACTRPRRCHRLFSAQSVDGQFDIDVVGGEGRAYTVSQDARGVKIAFGGMVINFR